MKKFRRILLIASFLLSCTIASAFPPDPDNDPGTGSNDPLPAEAPINEYVVGFLALGTGLAFWIISKKSIKE